LLILSHKTLFLKMKMARSGYVYLIGKSETDNIFKIGLTTGSIEKRIKKLQTGNETELYLADFHETKYPFFVEKTLHLRLSEYKKVGEWFELPNDVVLNFKKMCEDIENMIVSLKDNPFFQKILK